jgi:hypothetical protein
MVGEVPEINDTAFLCRIVQAQRIRANTELDYPSVSPTTPILDKCNSDATTGGKGRQINTNFDANLMSVASSMMQSEFFRNIFVKEKKNQG